MKEEELKREDLQELIDKAAEGDASAARELRSRTGGRFFNAPKEDVPPFLRGSYDPPNVWAPKSLEELREGRGYSRRLVDSFVDKACDEGFLPPGAAMILFVMMCTNLHDPFRTYARDIRAKLMGLYRFWDEAHPWVKANILYEMRERLYHQHHLKFCKAFAGKARQYDKLKAEEENGDRREGERQEEN